MAEKRNICPAEAAEMEKGNFFKMEVNCETEIQKM